MSPLLTWGGVPASLWSGPSSLLYMTHGGVPGFIPPFACLPLEKEKACPGVNSIPFKTNKAKYKPRKQMQVPLVLVRAHHFGVAKKEGRPVSVAFQPTNATNKRSGTGLDKCIRAFNGAPL